MKNNQNIIRCPQCDWEYLPGEIYLPKQFLGQPKEVTKTSDGKIDLYEGIEQNTCERFKCEHCNTTFIVNAKISYETYKDNKSNFDEDYSTPLYTGRINLKED